MEVIGTPSFEEWFLALDDAQARAVVRVVDLLEQFGVTLPFPHSSAIKGSSIALRELRATAGKAELRVLYAFDPKRNAVLLVGGDKAGDSAWYDRMILRAEREWNEYLANKDDE